MYVRSTLSLRKVEVLLFERGIDICHETVRNWWTRFGPTFTTDIHREGGAVGCTAFASGNGTSDHVLAPTPALADRLRELRDECASVWSRGIDRNLFSPDRRDMTWRRAHGIADDELAVLFFGRLVREKGIDIYAQTMRRLAGKARGVVIGAGPEAATIAAIEGRS